MKVKTLVKHREKIDELYKEKPPIKQMTFKWYKYLQSLKDALEIYDEALNNYIKENGEVTENGGRGLNRPKFPGKSASAEEIKKYEKDRKAWEGFIQLQEDILENDAEIAEVEPFYRTWEEVEDWEPEVIHQHIELGLFKEDAPEKEENPRKKK